MIHITHTPKQHRSALKERKAKNKPTRWGRFKGWTNRAHFSGFWMESQAKDNCFCCIIFKSHFNFTYLSRKSKILIRVYIMSSLRVVIKQLNAQTTEMMDAGPIVAIFMRQSMCFPRLDFYDKIFSLSHNTKLFLVQKKDIMFGFGCFAKSQSRIYF